MRANGTSQLPRSTDSTIFLPRPIPQQTRRAVLQTCIVRPNHRRRDRAPEGHSTKFIQELTDRHTCTRETVSSSGSNALAKQQTDITEFCDTHDSVMGVTVHYSILRDGWRQLLVQHEVQLAGLIFDFASRFFVIQTSLTLTIIYIPYCPRRCKDKSTGIMCKVQVSSAR